jgi:RecA/RadA recombinase
VDFLRAAEDVLFASPSRWPLHGVFPRSLLQQLQSRLRAGMESTCLRGTALWRREQRLQPIPITPDIDRLLGGGLHPGAVTEIVASSSAGKTQFCIQAATVAAMSGKSVCVIDTSSTFEMARGQQMAQKWIEKTTKVRDTPALHGREWICWCCHIYTGAVLENLFRSFFSFP